MGSFPPIEEWAAQYGFAIDDPDIKKKYEDYQEAIWEWNSILGEGRAEGLAEGRAEGQKEALSAMAAKLKELGVDSNVIKEATAAITAQNPYRSNNVDT